MGYWPAAGYRSPLSGAIAWDQNQIWSSVRHPGDIRVSVNLMFTKATLNTIDGTNRSGAVSVRCVHESIYDGNYV